MTIKQFNASYLIHDDRLLFRINTIDDSEYRFWMTRRVVLFILAVTNHLFSKKLEENHTAEAAKAMIEFGQEAAKAGQTNADGKLTEIQHQPASKYPIGVDPILVMDVKCVLTKEGVDDVLQLDFILPAGGVLNLKMAGNTLHAMGALLTQLAEHANWGVIKTGSTSSPTEAADSNIDKNLGPLVH
jgi:hypothetical protein